VVSHHSQECYPFANPLKGDSTVAHSSPDNRRIDIEQQLRQMNAEWVKALVRGDGETLDRIMADDFFFAYPMEGDDKAQFISDVTSGVIRVEYLNREKHYGADLGRDSSPVSTRFSEVVLSRTRLQRSLQNRPHLFAA
jgi:hypothetical protein